MIKLYQLTGRIRFSEIGEDGYLALHHLINYFQDCSTFHLEDIGLGADYFISQDLAFYMLSWQIEINRMPVLGEEIKVGTLIYGCKGMFGYRNYVLFDKDDHVLACANLCGCFFNPKTESFVKLTEEELAKYPIEPKWEMEYLPRKIKVPTHQTYLEPIQIHQYQIDTNGHVNNSQYVAIATEYLPKGVTMKQVRVDYKKAAQLGETLIPAIAQDDESYFVILYRQDLTPAVVVAFKI